MNIRFLCGILPADRYDEIIKSSKGSIQYAADALQKSIITGLSSWSNSLSIINLPYVGSYPKRYNDFAIKSYDFDYKVGDIAVPGKNIGFCNLTAYKLFSRYLNAYKALAKGCDGSNEVILIYAIHTPFLLAAARYKKKNPNVKIVLVVPDLPEYMAQTQSRLHSFLGNINQRILRKLYCSIDGWVLLSDHMRERLPVYDSPYTVVEGIFNQSDLLPSEHNTTYGRYVLYTGTLAKRYGILNLLNAFIDLKAQDVKLVICGGGDAAKDIIKASETDSRIIYKGLVKREEALILQQNATLLVNPRTPEGEFTKYSFPSKTMEYLASGIPTLLYKLPGIPSEYYDYCFSLTDLSVSALTEKLDYILSLSHDELDDIGIRAKQFIYANKSPINQTKKIVELINRL